MNRIETHNKPYLKKEIKIAIILILVFVFGTNGFITKFLQDYGIPALRLQQLWFFILPGLYILSFNYSKKRLKLKHILYFLLFYFTFYFMEHSLYGEFYIPGDQIDLYKKITTLNFTGMGFLLRWESLYLAFIFLINTEMKYFDFILRCTIIILLLNTLLIYLDVSNIINVANIQQVGYESFGGRLNSTSNLNIASDRNVFGIYCLVYLKILKKEGIKILNIRIPSLCLIGFLVILIFLQSARGSFMLLLAGLAVYAAYRWNTINMGWKIISILFISIIFLLQINIIQELSQKVHVVQRLQNTDFDQFHGEGRALQIYASWENFLSNPWIGIGYKNAASGIYSGITRSNFQYGQILASGGLILFSIYSLLIYKLFANNIKLLMKDKIVLSLFIYVLVLFIFRRPDAYLGIIAYIVYCQSIKNKRKVVANA